MEMIKRIIVVFYFLVVSCCVHSQIRVACIGNSITVAGYPQILGEMLGTKWEVKNFGVSGTTMLRNGDAPYYKTSTYTKAKEINPDVVIIKLGTNDSKPQNWKYKEQYVSDYTTMINELKALPSKPFIIVCYPIPAYSHGWAINDSIIRNDIIPMIKQVAKTNHVHLIDLYKPLSNHKDWFPDGIHPNKDGSTSIAKVVAKYLRKWRKKIEKRIKS